MLTETGAGGRGEIRTHETVARLPVFKTGALNHSATLPSLKHQALTDTFIESGLATFATLDPTWPQLRERAIRQCADDIGR